MPQNVTAEQFSGDLEDAKVGIIAASCVITGLSLLGVVGLLAVKGKVQAGLAVCCVQWVVVIALSLTTWGITYDKMKDAVEAQVEKLIIAVSEDLRLRVYNELETATKMNEMHGLVSAINGTSLNSSIPEIWLFLQAKWILFEGERRHSLASIYMANKYGYAASMGMGYEVWGVWPSRYSTLPSHWTCTVDGVGPATQQNCDRTNNPLKIVFMQWGSYALTLPARFHDNVTLNVVPDTFYDPTTRPWYAYTEESVWGDPYVFWDGDIGLTVTVGTKDSNGEWEGVLATDFKASTLRSFILELVPTKNAVILLYTSKGVLLSGSLEPEQLANSTGDLLNVWLANETTIARMMSVVRSKIGETVPGHTLIFHSGRHVVLTTPVQVSGGLEVVITIDIPYGDVLGDAEDASTGALLLVFLLSVGCMVLVATGVAVVLRPLRVLAYNMDLAAWMRVEGIRPVSSRISELASMIDSFEIMVENLVEYKKYLPDSLLAAQSDSEEDAIENSELSTSLEKGKGSDSGRSKATGSAASAIGQNLAQKATVFSGDMVEKRVSVAVVGLGGVSDMVKSTGNYDKFKVSYGEFLELVQGNTKEYKGTVDSLVGDRATIVFNAAVTNTAHRPRMCNALLRIVGMRSGKNVSVGAATGVAVCGNCGSSTLKTFKVFGKCVGMARALEQLCRPQNMIYISDQLVQSVETTYTIKKLFNVRFSSAKRPQIIAQLLEQLNQNDNEGEWMYALQDAEGVGFSKYNQAVELLVAGAFTEAEVSLKCSPLPPDVNNKLQERIATCKRTNEVEAPVECHADES